jgi:hypothetical protein
MINPIGELDFKDIKVKVYHDSTSDKNNIACIWQMRNPETSYTGIMYMNNVTGKISYPKDAIIPKQTDRDRELLPKVVVTGYESVDENFIAILLPKLEEGYKMRNRKQ